MILSTPSPDEVTGHAADMYRNDLDADGFVYQYTRAMALNPDAHAAYEALVGAIVPSLGLRTYELATLAAARAIGSPHCLLAHGRKSLRAGVLDEEQLVVFAHDEPVPGLSDADRAVMRFAARASTDAAAMSDSDSEELRRHGFTDRQLVDIALAAGVRNLFSRALLALAIPVDTVPGVPREVAVSVRSRAVD